MVVCKIKSTPNSFRKVEDPTHPESAKYFFYTKIDDIAEGIPMATNPRDQKLSSNVATAIRDSLESNDGYFHKKIVELLYLQSHANITIKITL